MGALDKFLKYMKLNDSVDDDDDEYDSDGYYDDGDDEVDEPAPRKNSTSKASSRDIDEDDEDDVPPAPKKTVSRQNTFSSKITPMRTNTKKATVGGGMEVCVIKPSSFEDAREITLTLLNNRTIVMNLEGLDVDIAQRILDFTSGSCFAIGGNLQKISMYIFIITPASVDISGDFQELLGTFDSSLHSGL